ncbi:hypothetical protein F4677DRAFT_429421 [Hypoxylon crocopeplum]|nr:hypothetical protein F4677DRAFT_429421 [Hypoxylon crocopeplum]
MPGKSASLALSSLVFLASTTVPGLYNMASKVTVDGIVLTIPDGYGTRCWEFNIVYSCGHPVTEHTCSHIHDKVIPVKHNNHSGPCWARRCAIAHQTHALLEKCHRCDMWDINFESNRS